MTDSVLPTVASTMRTGGVYLNHLSMAWYCQNDVMLGSAVVGSAVVP